MKETLFIAPPWWLAFLLALLVALLSYRWRLLTSSGAMAATICGGILYGAGGGRAIVPLLAFFLSSSILSKVAKKKKQQDMQRCAEQYVAAEKGDQRDALQVFANGGIPVLITLYFFLYARHHWPAYRLEALQLLFLSSIAAVNSDTWATEIGLLWGRAPRSLRDWKRVPPRVSGAISLAGTLGAILGALFIPLVAQPLWHLNLAEFVIVAWSGFLGSGFDSLLGASLQAHYIEPTTGRMTEHARSADGQPNIWKRGWRWVNNDVVNFLAALAAVLCAHYLIRAARPLFPPY